MDQHGYGPVDDDHTAAPDDGAVDEEILAELFMVMDDGPPDDLIKICDLFLTGVPARISDIRAALDEDRIEDAGKAAHSLKGTGGAFGARRLGEVAGRLEQACVGASGDSGDVLLEELQREFLVFRSILEIRLAALSVRH